MQTLQSGTVLQNGKYKIVSVLGQGSFGITYLAEHVNLGKKVAIKEFFMKELNSRGDDGSITGMSDGSLSYNYGQKFRKEAINLSRLENDHIVRVTDSFDENGTYYYVMDYIDGLNLNDYIKKNAISEGEAISIIEDVADALIYMHEDHKMLHLDLKPGNIMRRNSDGHIFLIDFGLSKHFSNDGQPETSTTIGLGTVGYAPVEQGNKAKNGEFRPTIDVYALGATLYKLLTRETPPAASELVSDDELLGDKLKEKSVSPNLIDLIVKAMLPNVRKRVQTIHDFKDMLSTVSSDDEGTLIVEVDEDHGEETIVEGKRDSEPKKPETKWEFSEATYNVETEYIRDPAQTKKNAEAGDLNAIIAYGIMCMRGHGVEKNLDNAFHWFSIAKDKGDARGATLVGQWSELKEKYKQVSSKPESGKEPDGAEPNYRLIIGIFLVVAFLFVAGFGLRGCGDKVAQDMPVDSVAYYDSTVWDDDAVPYDTIADTVAAWYY